MDAQRVSAAKPPSGRKMKARAPPPPGKPAHLTVHSQVKPPSRDGSLGSQQSLLSVKEQLRNSMMDVTVVLPSGLEKRSVISGSHAMMDLLVELCLQNHLNPSHHTLEIRSLETQEPLSFKPNTLVGTLDVHTVIVKEKVSEEKIKTVLSKVPEKSVLLVVNYLRTQKTVVRVSPEVPLQNLLPAICAKCEVSPEHVVLLRDNIAGEELELSKSLNELGIKELYAWDNKRESFRKSSLGNDETDKEKKKFLEFFKVHKRSNSKVEQSGLSAMDSEEDSSRSLGQGLNGCLTMPNSPSSKSRSLTLGPSLSLSNISGVSVKSDMKKRRAPPPPSMPNAGPPVQDRASEKMSLGSQIDLQKKKRRAPAPPPPQPPPLSPLIPNRLEDREEKRKSTTGVGRQVPQKPPRGSTRGPPQLVLPPPPPYPPPDTDVAEPVAFAGEGGGGGSEASDSRPTLNLPLEPRGLCGTDGVLPAQLEAEETVSVGSCFASEDTTEDSGVMSSPSDIVSLDSQHDSTKSKDKWATDQEDCSDQDLTGTPDLGLQKSPSWETSSLGTWKPRTEKITTVSSDEENLFVSGQFQKALAELDEDLEDMEESYETDTSSLTNSLNYCTGEAIAPDTDEDTIPVTFIGEVFDDPVDSGLFSNRNNNAGSFDLSSTVQGGPRPPAYQAEQSWQPSWKRAEVPATCAASQNAQKEIKPASCNTQKVGSLAEVEPKATSVAKVFRHDLSANGSSQEPDPTPNRKTQVEEHQEHLQAPRGKDEDNKNSALGPPSWYQRGQSLGGSYGMRAGLTTYKIVPPKSEMRCYDRGVSLSTGAIKIDELGNLVNPQTSGERTMAMKAETQPVGTVREFWRSSSVERQAIRASEGSTKKVPAAPMASTRLQEGGKLRPDSNCTELPGITSQQHPDPQTNGKHFEERRSQLPPATCHSKVPVANTVDISFLKPQRRTSSQYVASAIAKRIGPPQTPGDVAVRCNNSQKICKGGVLKPTERPMAASASLSPSQALGTHVATKDEAKPPPDCLPSTNGEESAVATQPREEVSSPSSKPPAQDKPVCTEGHRRPHIPAVSSSQRDCVSVGQSRGWVAKQNTDHHRTNFSVSNTRTTPSEDNTQTPGRALVRSPGWGSVPSDLPRSPTGPYSNGHIKQEPPAQEEKPAAPFEDQQEADGAFPPSIFGPKKKFRPVVQKPAPKDTSLHSALMEAIHSAGGRERLRKTADHSSERGPKKPAYTEAESERSALLAAIRGHRGTCSLRKVSSLASEELRSFRDASMSTQEAEHPGVENLGMQPPAPLPPPPPPASQTLSAPRASSGPLSDPTDARQALLDAIRSGTGAARLRKVPLLV